jgi:hypothetical protein
MSNKSNFTVDIFDFISQDEMNEEIKKEYGTEKLYIHAIELLDFIKSEVEKHPTYKDFDVQVLGIKRWEY